jgi:hypothetical protein
MASAEGTESLAAKRRIESPAIGEQWMEEVCERENCKQALARVQANQGSPGVDGTRPTGIPKAALASHPGTTVERNLQTTTGEASGNTETGRRDASSRPCWIALSSKR